MKRNFLSMLCISACILALSTPVKADCGEVTITEMNWASAQVVTQMAKFLMEQGYGCKVTAVPSTTINAATSLAETGKPDIVTEMWYNNSPAYEKIEKAGKVKTVANVFKDGAVEGWWIPEYLAKSNPELTKIDGILANPAAVGGKFHNCPVGWSCRLANDSYMNAWDFEGNGMDVFNHGSGETLATSIAAAYENKKPWFGYYWAPSAILGKYKMVKVDVGPAISAVHSCATNKDCEDKPKKSAYPASKVVTGVTNAFASSNPEITALMSKIQFTNVQLNTILSWKKNNKASAEEAAVSFIQANSNIWSQWLSASAKKKLAPLIK